MRRALALLAVTTAVLIGLLYLYFEPPQAAAPAAAEGARPSGAAIGEPSPRMEFALTVSNGRLVSGPAVLEVARGTEVAIRIRSDRADELHLHGYDLKLRIEPNEPAELDFVADKSGRFEYELHRADVALGVLEVAP